MPSPRDRKPHLIGGGTPTETARRMPWLAGVQGSYGMPRLSAYDTSNPILQAWMRRHRQADGRLRGGEGRRAWEGARSSISSWRVAREKGIKCVHVKPTLDRARAIKTVDEIELIKMASSNSERAFTAIPGRLSSRASASGDLGGYRTERELLQQRGRGPHRGLRLHERREHQPLRAGDVHTTEMGCGPGDLSLQ